tara:strand:- start:4570 stop:4968 length:399 start_codon:yes stop_codon:yes gene_type:complete
MKLKNRKKREYDDDGLLPLVNIIFLLLIFFMIAGVIEKRILKNDIEPPEVKLSKFENKNITKIFIDKNNVITANDKIINVDSVNTLFDSDKNKEVIIIADKSLFIKDINLLLDKLHENKITNIKLLSLTNAK